jgi:hypothetical protein
MITFALAAVSPVASSTADERSPPASLIARGLRHAGLHRPSVSERVLAAARWVPALGVGVAVERDAATTRSFAATRVYGQLAWPLGRAPTGDTIAAERDLRWRAAARDRLIDRISEAWQRRQHAAEIADDIAARLSEDEADAEIEALVGAEDAP